MHYYIHLYSLCVDVVSIIIFMQLYSIDSMYMYVPQIRRAEVFYWRAEHPELYSAATFPSVILYDETHHPFYAMPICEYPGLVKVNSQ